MSEKRHVSDERRKAKTREDLDRINRFLKKYVLKCLYTGRITVRS